MTLALVKRVGKTAGFGLMWILLLLITLLLALAIGLVFTMGFAQWDMSNEDPVISPAPEETVSDIAPTTPPIITEIDITQEQAEGYLLTLDLLGYEYGGKEGRDLVQVGADACIALTNTNDYTGTISYVQETHDLTGEEAIVVVATAIGSFCNEHATMIEEA